MKENIMQIICSQELQDGTGIDLARSALEIVAYKGRPFSVFVDEFVSHFAFYSCTATTLSYHSQNIEVESNDGSHFDSLDALGPGRQILKKCALARCLSTVKK